MTVKPMHYKCIHVQEAQELLNDPGTVIVDIRDKVSFQAGNIPNSINLSNEDIVDFLDSTDRKAPLLIYCYHGINSKDALRSVESRKSTISSFERLMELGILPT